MAYSAQVLHRARARLEQAKAEREQENAAHRADAYARYLQQAQRQKAFPIMPAAMDGEVPANRQSRERIREVLKTYLPQNPKAVEWIQQNYR